MQLFYVYLFLCCLIFLFFIYVDHLRKKASFNVDHKLGKKRSATSCNEDGGSVDFCTADIPRPRAYYGSFYLRLGTVRKTRMNVTKTGNGIRDILNIF